MWYFDIPIISEDIRYYYGLLKIFSYYLLHIIGSIVASYVNAVNR